MNLSTQGVRRLAAALGVAALLAVTGCDDNSGVPLPKDPPEVPTLEKLDPGTP